jgi:hypothetical protein
MIFSENRFTLFRIMLQVEARQTCGAPSLVMNAARSLDVPCRHDGRADCERSAMNRY